MSCCCCLLSATVRPSSRCCQRPTVVYESLPRRSGRSSRRMVVRQSVRLLGSFSLGSTTRAMSWMPGRFERTNMLTLSSSLMGGAGGGILVINVLALPGVDLQILAALAAEGAGVAHGVDGFFKVGIGGALDPERLVTLETVAVHLLTAAGQQRRGERRQDEQQHGGTADGRGAGPKTHRHDRALRVRGMSPVGAGLLPDAALTGKSSLVAKG